MTNSFAGPVELVPPEDDEHAKRYAEAVERYRRFRDQDGGGDAGVREPRHPSGPTPSLDEAAQP